MESTIASENDVQYQEQTNTYYTRRREDESPTGAIVRLVCTVLDRDVTEIPPLQRSVEADALNSIFDGSGSSHAFGTVEFQFANCEVTYRSEGVVVVEPRDEVAPVPQGPTGDTY